MHFFHRALFGVCAASLLAGCNYTATSTGAETQNPASTSSGPPTSGAGGGMPGIQAGGSGATGPTDSVTATASVAAVSVMAGASQTITVAFTSADGMPVSGLALSNTTLPPHWSGPGGFTCSATGAGSNCVLTLTYSPVAVETGTLKVGYTYAGDQSPPPGLSISIPYAGTATNNVIATPAPSGQINAVAGTGTQSVSINFTTDDGNTATALSVANLASLPTGWSTITPAFSCAIISNGSGCQLVLRYAPRTTGSGTLMVNYSYLDGTGASRTGTVNLPYSTTANGNVVATVSPTGQVNAVQAGGSQAVKVTFTTDDGKAARNLMVYATALPAGWSGSASGFTCGTVSTGNSCQLSLSYAPMSLTGGTLGLQYAYTSPGGAFTTGSLNIPYAATSNDNVVATANPSGEVDGIVAEVNPALAVTFTTDDGRSATALQLTTDLTSLPAGWTSTDTSLSCAGVSSGTSCQLPLTYTPVGADSGTLTLRYSYLNNAGQSKSGSLNVPYRSTTDDLIVGTPSVASLTVASGSNTPVTVTFATDDGNPASTLSVPAALMSLPAGWSSAGTTFTCTSVNAGTSCQLALAYAPAVADSGMLSLGFTYVNDAGIAKSGTVQIPYTATP